MPVRAPQISPNVRHMLSSSLRPTTSVPEGIVNLRSGEPFLETPGPIIDRMITALRGGRTHYARAGGESELRATIANTLSKRHEIKLGAEHVTVTHGGTGALTAAVFSVVGAGDRVVIPTPTYSLFGDLVDLVGGEKVYVGPGPNLSLDFPRIERELSGAVAVIVCNPCNPTGLIYSREEMLELIRLAKNAGVVLIADEAYAQLVYEPEEFHSVLDLAEIDGDVIYCQTFSKEFAMTGWRVGYTVSGSKMTDFLRQVSNSIDGSINTAAQDACVEALRLDSKWLDRSMDAYRLNRDLFLKRFEGNANLRVLCPQAGFFALVELFGKTGRELVEMCLRAGVAVRDGAEFGPGGEAFARFSFSTSPSELERALDLLEEVWK